MTFELATWHLFLLWTAGAITGFFAAAALSAAKDK
jgi:hypothetical protein